MKKGKIGRHAAASILHTVHRCWDVPFAIPHSVQADCMSSSASRQQAHTTTKFFRVAYCSLVRVDVVPCGNIVKNGPGNHANVCFVSWREMLIIG